MEMNRRKFLKNLGMITAGSIISLPSVSKAFVNCVPYDYTTEYCNAYIDGTISYIVAVDVGGQHLTQWCWAACIEMVFRYWGYSVSQERIVEETWGTIVNLPGQPYQILSNLNRPWVDDNGRSFSVTGDSYSANPVTAAQDLVNNMPLIIGTLGHAMVLTSIEYLRDMYGNVQPVTATVSDPGPGNGLRYLSPQEFYGANFLARIRVSSNDGSDDSSSSDDGGGGCFINTLKK